MTPRKDPDFQKLLPPLSADELAELEASILDEGVRDPFVIWLETGILLDGHNRLTITEKHGLPYPSPRELSFEDRAAARRWIIRNQLGRRNLTADWASYLRGQDVREAPKEGGKRTDRPAEKDSAGSTPLQALAEEHGVTERTLRNDANFAEAVDTVTEAAGDEARPTLLSGKLTRGDVKKLAEVAAEDPGKAKEAVRRIEEEKQGNARRALASIREDETKAKASEYAGTLPVVVYNADFRTADVSDDSIPLIFVDPPYGRKYADLWPAMGEFASRVLMPGGLLATYVGKLHFGECFNALAEHLRYYWLCAVGYEGAGHKVFGVRLWGKWRPIAVFSKGEPRQHRHVDDYTVQALADKADQELHPWAQGEVASRHFIEAFSEPGEVVLDPMCGTGTFLRVAASLGRSAIGYEIDPERFAVCQGLLAEAEKGA